MLCYCFDLGTQLYSIDDVITIIKNSQEERVHWLITDMVAAMLLTDTNWKFRHKSHLWKRMELIVITFLLSYDKCNYNTYIIQILHWDLPFKTQLLLQLHKKSFCIQCKLHGKRASFYFFTAWSVCLILASIVSLNKKYFFCTFFLFFKYALILKLILR